jgi:Fe2+ transport system protein B
MSDDKVLKEQLEETKAQLEQVKTENLNLRFDKVEQELTDVKTELTDIKSLIKEYVNESRINREEYKKGQAQLREEYLQGQKNLEERILSLEETRRNCPVKVVKHELGRYSRETVFIRGLFKNVWKGILISTLYIVVVIILVIAFGPNAIFEGLMKLKGL